MPQTQKVEYPLQLIADGSRTKEFPTPDFTDRMDTDKSIQSTDFLTTNGSAKWGRETYIIAFD